MWCVILALQSSSAVHLGLTICVLFVMLGVCLMVKDGDLLLLVERMLHLRGLNTVQVTKV